MGRDYILKTILSYRVRLYDAGLKSAADLADSLMDEFLDAGRSWQPLLPRIHNLITWSEQALRRIPTEG